MALILDAVGVTLGGRSVLADVSARLEPGRITAILGPNGAGKSSLVRAVAALLPHDGAITLDGGPVKLRVPQGTPNGRTFRVRGKGVTKRDTGKGDLLVTVEVVVPQSLNEQAREALASYGAAVGGSNPRARLFSTRSS